MYLIGCVIYPSQFGPFGHCSPRGAGLQIDNTNINTNTNTNTYRDSSTRCIPSHRERRENAISKHTQPHNHTYTTTRTRIQSHT